MYSETLTDSEKKDNCLTAQNNAAWTFKKIRPASKYRDEVMREKVMFPFTKEYNDWREALTLTAHLLKDKYGDLFDWDKFIDDAKSE